MMQSDHGNNPPSITADQKIKQDLKVLKEQINLCESMLDQCSTPASIDSNESLLSVIGFLEACVPRMVELIEAAASGAVEEGTFEECLVINDRLTNVLADVEKDPKDRMPWTPAAAAAPKEEEEPEIDLKIDNLNIYSTAKDKSEDPFSGGVDLLAPSPAVDPFTILEGDDTKPAAVSGKNDDDFDAFFKDRTSASQGGKAD